MPNATAPMSVDLSRLPPKLKKTKLKKAMEDYSNLNIQQSNDPGTTLNGSTELSFSFWATKLRTKVSEFLAKGADILQEEVDALTEEYQDAYNHLSLLVDKSSGVSDAQKNVNHAADAARRAEATLPKSRSRTGGKQPKINVPVANMPETMGQFARHWNAAHKFWEFFCAVSSEKWAQMESTLENIKSRASAIAVGAAGGFVGGAVAVAAASIFVPITIPAACISVGVATLTGAFIGYQKYEEPPLDIFVHAIIGGAMASTMALPETRALLLEMAKFLKNFSDGVADLLSELTILSQSDFLVSDAALGLIESVNSMVAVCSV